jgi:hypothetical protein
VRTDALEPPVPPGVGALSAPLASLADFLGIDNDLIAAAAEGSPSDPAAVLTPAEIGTWLLGLASAEKDALLVRLLEGSDPHLGVELRQRAARSLRGGEGGPARPLRRAGDLLERAAALAEARRKKEAEQLAQDRARNERVRAQVRRKHLESLVGREETLWGKVADLIATRAPRRYDEAVCLLQDLRDVAAMCGREGEFSVRMRALHEEHARKATLAERFEAARLLK